MVQDGDYNQGKYLETHFRCCELGNIRASLLGKKDCVGVGITFHTDSPARLNGYQGVLKFTW